MNEGIQRAVQHSSKNMETNEDSVTAYFEQANQYHQQHLGFDQPMFWTEVQQFISVLFMERKDFKSRRFVPVAWFTPSGIFYSFFMVFRTTAIPEETYKKQRHDKATRCT